MEQNNSVDNGVSSDDDHGSNIIEVEESAVEEPKPTTPPSVTHGKRILTSMQPELTVCDGYTPINLPTKITVLIILLFCADKNTECPILWLDAPIR